MIYLSMAKPYRHVVSDVISSNNFYSLDRQRFRTGHKTTHAFYRTRSLSTLSPKSYPVSHLTRKALRTNCKTISLVRSFRDFEARPALMQQGCVLSLDFFVNILRHLHVIDGFGLPITQQLRPIRMSALIFRTKPRREAAVFFSHAKA